MTEPSFEVVRTCAGKRPQREAPAVYCEVSGHGRCEGHRVEVGVDELLPSELRAAGWTEAGGERIGPAAALARTYLNNWHKKAG